MADETHQTAEPAAPELPGRSLRTPPDLDGEVESSEIISPAEASPAEAPPAAETPDVLAMAPPSSDMPPPEPPPAEPSPPHPAPAAALPPRRASLWPVAAGLVLGAVIAVGGAFGLMHVAPPPGPDGDVATQIDALKARIAGLEQKPAPGPDTQAAAKRDSEIAALATRVAAIEAAAKTAATTAEAAQGDAQKALAASSEAAARVPPPAPVDLGPLAARVAALEKRMAPLETALAETKTQIRATEDRDSAAVQQGTRAPALAVAAQSLLRAVEGGGAFGAQLATAERLGADPARVAALRPLADKGLPSPAQLAAQFAPVAEAAAKPADPPAAAGFLEHLKASAARLVQIRKTGDAPSDMEGPGRIMASLHRGDVAAALALWDALPPAPKAQSAAWAASAKGRLDALAAAHAIEADAVAALAKGKS